MNKKNLIVFDIDGTLTDTVPLHKAAFIQALESLDIRKMDTDFNAYRHHTDYHIAKTIYKKAHQHPFDEVQQASFEDFLYHNVQQANFSEICGAGKMISTLLSDPDFGICYATGSMLKPASHKLSHIGIGFDTLQLAASNGIEERENIVRMAIRQAEVFYNQPHFERIIAVGDGLWDLLTAQNLGLEFIGVGAVHQQLLQRHGVSLHFPDWQGFSPELIAVPVF